MSKRKQVFYTYSGDKMKDNFSLATQRWQVVTDFSLWFKNKKFPDY
jgi:hypothetical protein